MAKIIRLTESDLTRIVRRVIQEQTTASPAALAQDILNKNGFKQTQSGGNKQKFTASLPIIKTGDNKFLSNLGLKGDIIFDVDVDDNSENVTLTITIGTTKFSRTVGFEASPSLIYGINKLKTEIENNKIQNPERFMKYLLSQGFKQTK